MDLNIFHILNHSLSLKNCDIVCIFVLNATFSMWLYCLLGKINEVFVHYLLLDRFVCNNLGAFGSSYFILIRRLYNSTEQMVS